MSKKTQVQNGLLPTLKKAIVKKQKIEKKQRRFFRRQQNSAVSVLAPLVAHPSVDSEWLAFLPDSSSSHPTTVAAHPSVDSGWLAFLPDHSSRPTTVGSETSSDNTMRGVHSLLAVATEVKTPSDPLLSKGSTDNLLAGLFSPSDYQKNIDSLTAEDYSLNLTKPCSLCRLGLSPISEEIVEINSDLISDNKLCSPHPKDSLEMSYLQRLHVDKKDEEDSEMSSSEETKEDIFGSPRRRLTKKRPMKAMNNKERLIALEMEVHELRNIVEELRKNAKPSAADVATNTTDLVPVKECSSMSATNFSTSSTVNLANKSSSETKPWTPTTWLLTEILDSEKSEAPHNKAPPQIRSVRQRAALFEQKSEPAIEMEKMSKRQTKTV